LNSGIHFPEWVSLFALQKELCMKKRVDNRFFLCYTCDRKRGKGFRSAREKGNVVKMN
jgi:hypothetical protein